MHLPPNLIFDLGGILYGIDFECSIDAYCKLAENTSRAAIEGLMRTHSIWSDFEKGQVNERTFRQTVQQELSIEISAEEFDAAWNALLLGPLPGRLDVLRQLSQHHRIVLLSNTNSIHFRHLQPACQPLFEVMERLFLSYEMGTRKPEPLIYQKVLEEMTWRPEDCLFVDDSISNLKAAEATGIKVKHLPANLPTFDLL